MKKTVTMGDGRIFDIHFFRCGILLLDISIYEVKRPKRKKFFRTKFSPFYSSYKLIDEYDTIEDCLTSVMDEALKKEEAEKIRDKKIKDFLKTS